MVLSWDDVLYDAAEQEEGCNVVFHEFAHQLDDENGPADGVPPLPDRSMYDDWARVLNREYEQLRDDVKHHRKTLIDEYGATNPAEFFAVVTETFFCLPVQLKKRHPELYEQFRIFYNQDTAERELRFKRSR